MKAAVIFQKGEMPEYTEIFPEPITENDEQIIMNVKAVAIKHLDKAKASGKHYSTENEIVKGKIVGSDGAGFLEDGTRIFAFGNNGTVAEKVIIDKKSIVKIPHGMDFSTASALPNAIAGSAMALRFRAKMESGETVLINGATGFTGKVAVQIAKHYGAKKIIVTGRNLESLVSLKNLGADEFILTTNAEDFVSKLKEIHQQTPIDIVIDYLWGETAELILTSLKGNGRFSNKTRFVSIGAMTGDKIQMSSEILRSVDLQLSGSGLGSWTKEEMQILFKEIIPEMFQLHIEGKLNLETINVPLPDVEKLWEINAPSGKRLVITI